MNRRPDAYIPRRGRPVPVILLILLFSLLFGLPIALFGLDAESADELIGAPVRITTSGREDYQGTLYAVLPDRIELVPANGQIIQILTEEIDSIEALDLTAGKRALFQDAATNRLMVMPTAFPMGKGEFHVTDQEIIVVTGSYGLTNNISVWAGISIPGFILSGRASFHLGPNVGVSTGAFAGVEWFDGSALLLPYGLVSVGSQNRNFTAGGAAVFSTNNGGLEGAVAAVGGKIVLTPTSALVTENWFIWNLNEAVPYPSINVLGLSFRIAGSRLSWDIGAVVPVLIEESYNGGGVSLYGIAGDTIIPLPLISLTYRID